MTKIYVNSCINVYNINITIYFININITICYCAITFVSVRPYLYFQGENFDAFHLNMKAVYMCTKIVHTFSYLYYLDGAIQSNLI